MDTVWVKHLLVRTPLERPLKFAREFLKRRRNKNHALRDIYLEDSRMEQIMRMEIRPDTNCVDIGSHIGSVLSRFVSLAPEGKHLAFEADPRKAEWLRRKFPEAEVHNVALYDTNGLMPFYIQKKRAGYSGLARSEGDDVEVIQVPCKKLDDMVRSDRRYGFVKIDVEGAEYFALRGARAFLTRDRPTVLFECGPSGPQHFGYTLEDLFNYWREECGYSIYFLKDWLSTRTPVTLEQFQSALVYPFKAFNWVAAPRN